MSKKICIVLLISFLVITLLSSCATRKHSTTTSYIHDTIIHTQYIENVKYDSIYKYDSVYIYSLGDTIFKYKDKYIYKYKYIHDTAYLTDTIYRNEYINKEIVKENKNKFKEFITYIVIVLLLSAVVYLLYKYEKYKQK